MSDPLELSGLPRPSEILAPYESAVAEALRYVLSTNSLAESVTDLVEVAGRVGEHDRRQVLLLLKAVVARMPGARSTYENARRTLADGKGERIAPDALPLALEFLKLFAWLFAGDGDTGEGLRCFDVAARLALRAPSRLHSTIVLYQRGVYAAAHLPLTEAVSLLAESVRGFRELGHTEMAEAAELTWARHAAALMRDGEAAHMGLDPRTPRAVRIVMAALIDGASSRGDLREAARHRDMARGLPRESADPVERREIAELLLAEAALERRLGDFEQADILLERARALDAEADARGSRWQDFYFMRDLGMNEHAVALLQVLPKGPGAEYQRGALDFEEGDTASAARHFEAALATTRDPQLATDCKAMLGMTLPDARQAHRFLFEAIAEYLADGRTLDHAISLSHLAALFFVAGAAEADRGLPPGMVPDLRRAYRHLEYALAVAADHGATGFATTLDQNMAVLADTLGRPDAALRHLLNAIDRIERTYLLLTSEERADVYLANRSHLYDHAISAAVDSGLPDIALHLLERYKAHRFYREIPVTPTDEELAARLALVRSLRRRVRTTAALTLEQQETLNGLERRLLAEAEELDLIPMSVPRLRAIVYGEPVPAAEPAPKPPPLFEPGRWTGGAVDCENCKIFNKIGSRFCSACEALLTRTETADVGEDVKHFLRASAIAEDGFEPLEQERWDAALPLFVQAWELSGRQEWAFYVALCLLGLGEVSTAEEVLDAVTDDQFAAILPLWRIPVPPSAVAAARRDYRESPASAPLIARSLVRAARSEP
ncbi:tetratricopeptide repeat protein [Microbispora sp. H13382]|uniref:tetratricopeptide repeat protein n=1 Tax=Microbispora sp. H13382 TaxID=2729112 RepID=UPI0016003DC5|nr:tetratricopeptide repeat protein [Microbispora sp. H13382]